MRILAVDWSGDRRAAATRIRVAEARPGELLDVRGGLDRAGVGDLVLDLRDAPAPVVVGMDFSFGLPGWFATERRATTLPALWDLARDDGEGWLRACEPPFWGRAGTRRPTDVPLYRRTELDARDRGLNPLSTFQVGGAGAVGTGSIRGMPLLGAWRRAGVGVWPLDAAPGPRGVLVVEIYPRAFTGPVVKSSATARRGQVDADPRIPVALREAAAATEDAFDAAHAALGMAEHAAALAALSADPDPTSLLEGRLWLPPV
ncbi:hypothetical protein [Actinomycetospora atypica]|uniref:DUF429 domain-containing protein n=1 Tax=Actinomycetospora atypica TaxID=1290095 RepID=A0ABV9YWL1_9PSEU